MKQKEKLKLEIGEMISNRLIPLNQKLDLWGKVDTATVNELKQIKSELNYAIIQDISKACKKIQGL